MTVYVRRDDPEHAAPYPIHATGYEVDQTTGSRRGTGPIRRRSEGDTDRPNRSALAVTVR